jgi:hypothetical protein
LPTYFEPVNLWRDALRGMAQPRFEPDCVWQVLLAAEGTYSSKPEFLVLVVKIIALCGLHVVHVFGANDNCERNPLAAWLLMICGTC